MTSNGEGRVTMADVAREAGVSIASASRALSGAPGVSAATTARIREIADRLSYVVSPEASALSRRRTSRVGVVTTHLDRWYYGAALEGIEAALSAHGLDMLVYCVSGADERRRFFERLPARRKVDGVIVIGMPASPAERERLALLDVAIVAAGGQSADYPYVSIDDERAGEQAMDHLLFLGHTRIAMIDAIDPNEEEWPIGLRARAYHDALLGAGIDPDPELFVRVPWGIDGGAEGMRRLLSLRRLPTAVFVHSDDMAFGALHVARRAGLKVPIDVSVVSIDDHPVSRTLDLTTVRQDAREQGRIAAEAIAAAIQGAPVEPAVLVQTVLVPRGSTAAPREGSSRGPE
jgi:DNA-binding LacI/PurR family transcriptional regulator